MNGRFPDTSYGKGAKYSFTDFVFKGGATYKFNGRHFLTANISYGTGLLYQTELMLCQGLQSRLLKD